MEEKSINKASHPGDDSNSSMQGVTKTTIDERGDLTLIVGQSTSETNKLVKYQVCSRTLARSSPVFKTMLYGSFAESKPKNDVWIIELPDDDNAAMSQLLHLMHGDHERCIIISDYKACNDDIKPVYEFFIAMDKYDCTKLLRPYSCKFTSVLDTITDSSQEMLYMLSWIYFQLGHQTKFEDVVTALSLDAHTSNSDPEVKILPPSLLDNVCEARATLIERMLEPFQKSLTNLFTSDRQTMISYCQRRAGNYYSHYDDSISSEDCANRMLGALVSGLIGAGLWPVPEPSDVQMSPRALSGLLRAIRTVPKSGGHGMCSAFGLLQKGQRSGEHLEALTDEVGIYKYTATPEEIAAIRNQARKVGLDKLSKPKF